MNDDSMTGPEAALVAMPREIEFDADRYIQELDDMEDVSDAAKRELLKTLWQIMRTFVGLGFRADICGQLLDLFNALSASESDALDSNDSTETETLPKRRKESPQ